MTGRHMSRRSKRARRVWQRPMGAVTAVVLALGGIVVTETVVAPSADAEGEAGVFASEPLWHLDFENESGDPWSPWYPSGNPKLTVVDDPGPSGNNKVLSIKGNTDYDSIQSPTSQNGQDVYLIPGREYNVEMRARLVSSSSDAAEVRFVGKPGYQHLAKAEVSQDAWTTLTGTWIAPEPVTTTDSGGNSVTQYPQIYIGVAPVTAPASTLPGTEGETNDGEVADLAATPPDDHSTAHDASLTGQGMDVAGTLESGEEAENVEETDAGEETDSGALAETGTYSFEVLVDDIIVTERGEPELTVLDGLAEYVPGGAVKVQAELFAPNKNIEFQFSQGGTVAQTRAYLPTDSNGHAAGSITLPRSVAAGQPVTITATSETKTASVEVDLQTPTLSITSHTSGGGEELISVPIGAKLTVVGTGFPADWDATLSLGTADSVTVHADLGGHFEATIDAPNIPNPRLALTATSATPAVASAHVDVEVVWSGAISQRVVAVDDPFGFVRGDRVTVWGAGFKAGAGIHVKVQRTDPKEESSVYQTTADSEGMFTYEGVEIPNWWPSDAEVTVIAYEQIYWQEVDGTMTASKPFIIAKSILVKPASGSVSAEAGGELRIVATGYRANTEVQISAGNYSASIPADAEGRLITNIPVPDAIGMQFNVRLDQWGESLQVEVTVTEPQDPYLVADPRTVPQDSTFDVTGKNIDSAVNVYLRVGQHSPEIPVQLENSTFNEAKIPVPFGTGLGELEITLYEGLTKIASTTIDVVAPTNNNVPEIAVSPLEGGSFVLGEPFTVTGRYFQPNSDLIMEYMNGDNLVGQVPLTSDSMGRVHTTNAVVPPPPSTAESSIDITIRVRHADTGVSLSVATKTFAWPMTLPTRTITIDVTPDAVFHPGAPIPLTGYDLYPGSILVDFTAASSPGLAFPQQVAYARANGTLGASVTIPRDTITGTARVAVEISAAQGPASAGPIRIQLENNFDPYKNAHTAANALLERRNKGDFPGTHISWGQLDSLVAKFGVDSNNEFGGMTQRDADDATARLVDGVQQVVEDLLGELVGTAQGAVATYDEAVRKNPALSVAVSRETYNALRSLIDAARAALVPQVGARTPTTRTVTEFTFDKVEKVEQPGLITNVWTKFDIVPRPGAQGDHASVLRTRRVNDWEGIELDTSSFHPGDVCTFSAEVMYDPNGDTTQLDSLDVRFLAHSRTTDESDNVAHEYAWIANRTLEPGEWLTATETWTVPEYGVQSIRLVAGPTSPTPGINYANSETPGNAYYLTFLADNITVSCTGQPVPAPDIHTSSGELLEIEGQLRAALDAFRLALATFDGTQMPWAPPSGLEPGWIAGNPMFTDDGVARWIGRNLYIRGDSSELEGLTVVNNDLSLDKSPRSTEEIIEWSGFNFGQVTIGSHIVPGDNKLALVVCGDMEDPNHGASYPGGGQGNGKPSNDYCGHGALITQDGVDDFSKRLFDLSTSATALTPDDAGVLTLSTTNGRQTKDGLYVFTVDGATLENAQKLVIDGLQVSDPTRPGHILSMLPAVINVTGMGPIDWEINEISVRDQLLGYEQVYANGNTKWHQDLGIVSGALMWNFGQATDARATSAVPDVGIILPLEGDDPGKQRLPGEDGGAAPAVTIRNAGLGLNFMGSILIPNGSLKTVNVSLNGRQYIGGDWLMDDVYEWDEAARENNDCPLVFVDGPDPFVGGSKCDDAHGNLLGHSEGHNYPWWFDPFSAAPSGSITIAKDLDGFDSGTTELFAVGELHCMHVENVTRFGLDLTQDAWWEGHDDNLMVDATWWVRPGADETVTVENVPYGAACTISERPGMYKMTDQASGIDGKLREGQPSNVSIPEDISALPDFGTPVTLDADLAWAAPEFMFDGLDRPAVVTNEGPTASFLLTTKSVSTTSRVKNAVQHLGTATITKKLDEGVPEALKATEFVFTWTTQSDGYVKGQSVGGTDVEMHLVAGTRTGQVPVRADGTAQPQFCPAGNLPTWWPDDDTRCLDLFFPAGTTLTWTEVTEPVRLEAADAPDGEAGWYEWIPAYDGGPDDPNDDDRIYTVTIPEDGSPDAVVATTATNALKETLQRFTVSKKVTGTGAGSVPSAAKFTVTYQAFNAVDELLNADCAAPDPLCTLVVKANGVPVTSAGWEVGTRIVLREEPTSEATWGVAWESPKFTLAGTDESAQEFRLDGIETAAVAIDLTNTAVAPAEFSLYKALSDFDRQELSTSPSTQQFDLQYVVNEDPAKTLQMTSNYGNNSAAQRVTGLKLGDVVTVSERLPADGRWKPELVEITFWADGAQLATCSQRGFESNPCPANAYKVTGTNSNTVTVRVTNTSQSEPKPSVMPMTGGSVLAWIALTSGLALAGFWSLTRAQSLRRPATRGGQMR